MMSACSVRALRRALSTLGAIPSSSSWSSLKRRGPSSRAATIEQGPAVADAGEGVGERGGGGAARARGYAANVNPALRERDRRELSLVGLGDK